MLHSYHVFRGGYPDPCILSSLHGLLHREQREEIRRFRRTLSPRSKLAWSSAAKFPYAMRSPFLHSNTRLLHLKDANKWKNSRYNLADNHAIESRNQRAFRYFSASYMTVLSSCHNNWHKLTNCVIRFSISLSSYECAEFSLWSESGDRLVNVFINHAATFSRIGDNGGKDNQKHRTYGLCHSYENACGAFRTSVFDELKIYIYSRVHHVQLGSGGMFTCGLQLSFDSPAGFHCELSSAR